MDTEASQTTITHEDLGEDLRKIIICGRLDTPGTNAITEPLRELAAAPKRGVIVDLSAVEYVSSIGLGQLIANAKAVKSRGGHLVLIASGGVMMILKTSGLDQVIPSFTYATDAHVAALRGF